MSFRLFFLAFLISLSLSPASFADSSCKVGWVETHGSLMMALRSNPCHFWAWSATNATKYLPTEILDESGWLTGDPHHENFAHVFIDGKRTYVLDDLDDSGYGPFFLDFLKFFSVSRSVTDNSAVLSTEAALTAYLAGLRGEKWTGAIPRLIQEDAEVSAAQLHEDYLKKIKKKTSDGEFDPAGGLTKWSEMSADQQTRFTDLENRYFKKYIPEQYTIKDRAFYTKEGRDGTLRAWYYLKNGHDDRQILEFKEMSESALSEYQTQRGSEYERKRKVLQAYWGASLPPLFGVVGDAEHVFWMRPKFPTYIDFSNSSFHEDLAGFSELTYFISFKLGHWHGEQLKSGKYSQSIASNLKNLTSSVDKFTSDYLNVARARHKGR
jgi:hypothetical protein